MNFEISYANKFSISIRDDSGIVYTEYYMYASLRGDQSYFRLFKKIDACGYFEEKIRKDK